MTVPVVAILGAGASLASGNYPADLRPPLTRDLFSGLRANALLREYPLARKAGRLIARDMKADTTLAFEQALLGLRTDGNPQHAHMALAVPLYLQALLLKASEELVDRAERYDLLVDDLLQVPSWIHFVTLNYDVLLDNALSPFFRLDEMADYIANRRGQQRKNWSLIKLHGSVNWAIDTDQPFDPLVPAPELDPPHGPIYCYPPDEFRLLQLRGTSRRTAEPGGPTAFSYPAIALPEGPKDRLVLPDAHLDYFKRSLADARQVDLLVLGYSARDSEVLTLITDSGTQVRRMTVVNRDAEANLEVFATIARHGIEALWPDVYDGSFVEWVDQGALRTWVREFDGVKDPAGPYPSLTSPDDLHNRIERRAHEHRVSGQSVTDWLNDPM